MSRDDGERPLPTTADERWRLLVRAEGMDSADRAALLAEVGIEAAVLESWRRRARRALEPRGEERPTVEVRLFGAPTFRAADVVRWSHRRCRDLVALLALRPDRVASRSRLLGALWPDASADAVRRTFHPTLSAARRSLREAGVPGDPIPHEAGSWRLASSVRWEVDVVRFRRLLDEGSVAPTPAAAVELLEAAWQLRRGPFLEGTSAAWAEEERDRLRREHRRLLERLGAGLRELGRRDEALDALRSLLVEEPLAENVHVAVLEIYAEKGRPDLVRRQFLRLQELLAEIDVEPSEGTQRRVRELLGT